MGYVNPGEHFILKVYDSGQKNVKTGATLTVMAMAKKKEGLFLNTSRDQTATVSS